jgi:hypothetical protein
MSLGLLPIGVGDKPQYPDQADRRNLCSQTRVFLASRQFLAKLIIPLSSVSYSSLLCAVNIPAKVGRFILFYTWKEIWTGDFLVLYKLKYIQ